MDVAGGPAPAGEKSFPVIHVATIPLPIDAADYGSDVVGELGRDDALVVLKEFDPESASSALLRRSLPGLAGHQAFFHEEGRAFCLYVVLKAFTRRAWVVPKVNEVLATLTIEPVS